MSGSICDVNGVRYIVVELEVGPSACQHPFCEFYVAYWDTSCFHVVDELFLHSIGEGSLDIEEEGDGHLARWPGVFDFVGDNMHGICCVMARMAIKLATGEQGVFLSKMREISCNECGEEFAYCVEKTYEAVSFGNVVCWLVTFAENEGGGD